MSAIITIKTASMRDSDDNDAESLSEENKDGEQKETQLNRPTSAKGRQRGGSFAVSPVGPQLRPYADNCVASRPVYATLLSRRMNEPLGSTKLCSALPHSASGHVPGAYARKSHMIPEYSGLHDPHTRSYFYQPQRMETLVKNGFLTPDLRVVCPSLKEYNTFQELQEIEHMELNKTINEYEAEQNRREKLLASEIQRKKQENECKEEKTKQYLNREAQRKRDRELELSRSIERDYRAKMKALEERRAQWEDIERQRETEGEQRKLNKQISERQESIRMKKLRRECEESERLRDYHLAELRDEEKREYNNKMVRRWQQYEEHTEEAREVQLERKAEAQRDRENRIKQRGDLSNFINKKHEDCQSETRRENRRLVEQLKEEADYLERKRQEMKENEVNRFKAAVQRRVQRWDDAVNQRKEATKREQEQHLKKLFDRVHLPSVTTRRPPIWRRFRTAPAKLTSADKSSRSGERSTVHFSNKLTVHVIDNLSFSEDSKQEESVRSEGRGVGGEDDESVDVADLNHKDSYDIQLKKSRE